MKRRNSKEKNVQISVDWSILAKKIVRKLIKPVYFKEELLLLTRALNAPESHIADTIIQLVNHNPGFLDTIKKCYRHKYDLFKRRLNQGLWFFVTCLSQDDPIYYGWFATDNYYEPKNKFMIQLGKNQIYGFDQFVNPEFRRKKVGTKSIQLIWKHFLDYGYTDTLCVVNKSNIGSLKWHTSLGFKEAGKKIITHFVFGRPFSYWKTYSGLYVKPHIPEESTKNKMALPIAGCFSKRTSLGTYPEVLFNRMSRFFCNWSK